MSKGCLLWMNFERRSAEPATDPALIDVDGLGRHGLFRPALVSMFSQL
jgi:hypothetical protein